MLETERLILRKFKETDAMDFFEYAQMTNVGPHAGWAAYGKDDYEKAIARVKKESTKEHQYAIVLKKENKVIGSVELMDIKTDRYTNLKTEDGAKELGYVLSEKYWGNGYMPEAVSRVMEYAFDDLNTPVIYVGHAAANTSSARVQEKLGFEIVGKVSNYRTWVDGKETDYIERKMTKEEWLNKKHSLIGIIKK